MITYLKLTNFRRHAETELHFSESDQVVLVSGNNGAGKSTIFEAVQYALYGEGRNGRANIERLVRKGGELEGLEVEIRFEIAGVSYTVRRRRDSKLSSAILLANDIPLMEGAREVTAEVAKILGMDSRGFRLATYAQQRELDGLASMRPADRGQMLSRLLRLDVVSRAKETARGEFRQRREVLRAIGTAAGVVETETALLEVRAELETVGKGLDAARDQVAILDAEIAAGGATEEAYQAAKAGQVRLEALVSAAETEVARARAEMESIVVPENKPAPGRGLEDLQRESTEVERSIAEGEAANKQLERLRIVRGEIARCDERLKEIDDLLTTKDGADLDSLQVAATMASEEAGELVRRRGELRDAYVATKERLEVARRTLEEVSELGAECQKCKQSIPEDHRERHIEEAASEVERLESAYSTIVREGEEVGALAKAAEAKAKTAESLVREKINALEEERRLEAERSELLRRRDVYLDQTGRLQEQGSDLKSLYTRRAEILVETNLAMEAREAAMLRRGRLEQRQQAERTLASAVARRDAHRVALAEGSVSLDLEEAHDQIQKLADARRVEAEVAAELQATLARLDERGGTLERELTRLKKEEERRGEVDHEAQVALYASQALERVETLWAQQIRPSLEGTVSELVARLSDNRFDAVQFSPDYEVSVRDRGVVRPISELSGGEIDLVALAVRLGLASVVSERHGAGGAGFLILDECFGSQDPDRRISIMNALRGLKQTHGQIFLISHVGGLEDSADAVIEVGLDEEANAVAVRT